MRSFRPASATIHSRMQDGPGATDDIHRARCLRWLDRAWFWRILLEGQVGSRPVVAAEIAAQTKKKVALVQHDHVVEELCADAADQALDKRVLPGRARGCENLGDADGLHPSAKLGTTDAVAIPQHVAGRRIIWERLDELSRGPGGGWGIRHIEKHDSACMQHDDR